MIQSICRALCCVPKVGLQSGRGVPGGRGRRGDLPVRVPVFEECQVCLRVGRPDLRQRLSAAECPVQAPDQDRAGLRWSLCEGPL